MSDSSESSLKRREHSRSEEKPQGSKLFITNIDGKADLNEIESELKRLFEKFGTISSLVAKRNRNSQYCFAFAEMKDHAAAAECVKAYDQSFLAGKQIKVEFQDDSKRRKDSNKGCYNCGKMGHFARECHSSRVDNGRGYHRRSRSRSEESYRHKKSKKKRSQSSERGRSRSPKSKKDRKYRSRDRDQKKKKKHHRHSYSSDS